MFDKLLEKYSSKHTWKIHLSTVTKYLYLVTSHFCKVAIDFQFL